MDFIAQARGGRPAGAPGGTRTRPGGGAGKPKGNLDALSTPLAVIALAVAPTIFWGFFQFGWVFDLIQDMANIAVPGTGFIVRWLLFLLFGLGHFIFAWKIGGPTQPVQTVGPTGPITIKMHPSFWRVVMWVAGYWIISVLLVIFVKPFIVNNLITPAVSYLIRFVAISPWADTAPELVAVAQKAGLKVNLPTAEAAKSLEERVCGKYTKYDEQGNVISGGKQLDVAIDAPPWSKDGSFYRATVRINNLGKEPINVVIESGKDVPGKVHKVEGKEPTGELSSAEGSFIKGQKKLEDIKQPVDVYYLLTPLSCLEPVGCIVEPGLERSVELLSTKRVSFQSNQFAEMTVKIRATYDGKKAGVGTGHLLIFEDREDALARQKSSDFKKSYCPSTFAGPLDVVVTPPFYTPGDASDGGDGYFQAISAEQCPASLTEFRFVGQQNYCLTNVKNVKVKLVNTDKNARIQVKSIKVTPSKVGGEFPREYTAFTAATAVGNCFLERLGEGESGIIFTDEKGTEIEAKSTKALAPIISEATFLCRYQINDFPSEAIARNYDSEWIENFDFRAFQFKAEIEYDYLATFKKSAIPMISES